MQKLMIEFKRFHSTDGEFYAEYFPDGYTRGCEFSFANLYLWGKQSYSVYGDSLLLMSQFGQRTVYPFPLGRGEKASAVREIMRDAEARGLVFRMSGISPEAREMLETEFPETFRFHTDEGSYDYVYSLEDLAELKGKKYHTKKNHVNRFIEDNEGYEVVPIGEGNIPEVTEFIKEWYRARLERDPNADFTMETVALDRALRHYTELGLEGIMIKVGGRIVAVTMASRMTEDTFDVNFEKAIAEVNGAYAMVNYEFARYIRNKYPEVTFLDREEDMGIEGLRRAKESYRPHHKVIKYWATLLKDENED